VDKAGLAHRRVEFELTESAVMTDPGAAQQTLADLSTRGFRLSIDDFGTGHSSLSYVHRLPVHRLKVDRSFLRRERGDRETEIMMKALVGLGAELGLEVIAEGVESDADLARVRASGCTLAQGFYFAPPQHRDDILASLDAWEARAASAVPA
jgi:diguanylate cyclase